jgi:hypothetical protein
MTRARHADGSQHLYLNMGYFPTREDANKCVQIMRGRYPQATVTEIPARLLPQTSSAAHTGSFPQGRPVPEPPVVHGIPPEQAGTLTDTQVLNILETRRVQPAGNGKRPADRPEISLLRPEDTNTRRALKEAVVQGAPISFVVQLCRSDAPIKLASVPALDIFRAYTLYLAEGMHEGERWYALRMGFFNDADSAKQVAYYARTNFGAIAVVPINEGERCQASKSPIGLNLLAPPMERSIDDLLAADQAQTADPAPTAKPAAIAPAALGGAQNRATSAPKERRKDSLEQTLELLASSELWNNSDDDTHSQTGVRHLKVEVQKHKRSAGRS